MTIEELKRKVISETKTLNSRLRRLEKEGLPSTAFAKIQQAKAMGSELVTDSGMISARTAGYTQKQLMSKLKWIRGISANTQSPTETKKYVAEKQKEWGTSYDETVKRINQGRVFYQAVGYRGGIFDSDRVHLSIEEFESTPSYDELITKLFMDFGVELQDEINGRWELLKFMNDTGIIPPGVNAEKKDNGQIVYKSNN